MGRTKKVMRNHITPQASINRSSHNPMSKRMPMFPHALVICLSSSDTSDASSNEQDCKASTERRLLLFVERVMVCPMSMSDLPSIYGVPVSLNKHDPKNFRNIEVGEFQLSLATGGFPYLWSYSSASYFRMARFLSFQKQQVPQSPRLASLPPVYFRKEYA